MATSDAARRWSFYQAVPVDHLPADPSRAGLAVQKQIVGGDRVDALYAGAPADEQHVQRYLSANCFGDHLTRTGLGLPERELLTFAMLAALGGGEAQGRGHVAATSTSATTARGCWACSPC